MKKKWLVLALVIAGVLLLGSILFLLTRQTEDAPPAPSQIPVSDFVVTDTNDYFTKEQLEELQAMANAWEEDHNLITVGETIAKNFDEYVQQLGFVLVDVTDLNSDAFPSATVKQAGDGHIDLFCLSGTENDAGLLWSFYYEECLNNGDPSTFVQKWVPGNPHAPCSVEAVVNGQYVRAELVGGTCVSATTYEETLIRTISSIMAGIGVPENNAVIK